MLSERAYHERRESEGSSGWDSRFLKFAIKLKEHPPNEETHEQHWLEEHERAPDWLELFYDLVIVAVLSVFSSAHEVSSPQSVLVYFSYFVIIWWVWASQTMYDVHFQANDWLHRIFKCLQLAAFAFVGATSANFDPFNILPPDEADALTPEGILQSSRATSWKGVAVAYAAGRFILVLQYMLVAIRFMFPKLGAEVYGRKRHLQWVLIPAAVYSISGLFWIIAGLDDCSRSAKLGLAYTGIGMEFLSAVGMPLMPGYNKPPASMISERFGALTLIILGEGIIGIVRTFSQVISGFGFSSDQYLQCFCGLIIIFASWHFLFHGFNTEQSLRRKSGALWLILHLPLHFVMLLLLSGMKNATVYGNVGDALMLTITNLNDVLGALSNNTLDTVSEQNTFLAINLGKIDVEPDYLSELSYWNSSFNDANSTNDASIEYMSYLGSIFLGVAESYGMELSDEVEDSLSTVLNFNTTKLPDENARRETETEDYNQLMDFVAEYFTDIAQGTLFFLPCAGGLVFFASLLVLLRAPPLGKWMWLGWCAQVVVSIGLCLLGFLDVGSKVLSVDETRELAAYRLLDANWMLPTVAIAYSVLILTEYFTLVIARRSDPRRRDEAHDDARSMEERAHMKDLRDEESMSCAGDLGE